MSVFSNFDELTATFSIDVSTSKNEPKKDSIVLLVLTTICEGVEFFLIAMVIISSWQDYRKSNRSCSVVAFVRSLPTMRKCFLGTGAIIFVFNTIYLIYLILPLKHDDDSCTFWVKITGRSPYTISLAAVYLYLWVRQYLLHSSRVLRAFVPRWFYVLSKASVVLTIVAFLVPPAIDFNYQNGYLTWGPVAKYENGHCFLKKVSDKKWYPTFISVISVVTQLSYLILFYKTLKLHQENNKNANNSDSENRLNQLAKRCFYFSMATVFSDCVSLILTAYSYSRFPIMVIMFFGKVDLMFNMVCLIFCFNKLPRFFYLVINAILCGKYKKNISRNKESTPIDRTNITSLSPGSIC